MNPITYFSPTDMGDGCARYERAKRGWLMQLDTVVQADALTYLQSLPDESVHLIVTSPPYFGLRDYGTGTWSGGDPACAHDSSGRPGDNKNPQAITAGVRAGADNFTCRKCGATRTDGQMGLEGSPQEYVARLVAVFHEAKRVLRRDGNLFVNLDDSYVGHKGKNYLKTRDRPRDKTMHVPGGHDIGTPHTSNGIPNKSLMAVPERFLIAMIDDGWVAREKIAWVKGNPMPESMKDRCTRSFEMIYHFSKTQKHWMDMAAVSQPTAAETFARAKRGVSAKHKMVNGAPGQPPHSMNQPREHGAGSAASPTRNLRNVWRINTQSFKGAHFATYPEKLVSRIIGMACPETVCSKCGAGYVPVIEKTDHGFADRTFRSPHETGTEWNTNWQGATTLAHVITQRVIHYAPSCKCGAGTAAGIVLDPFMGAGTTAVVAKKMNRRYLGCDLNAEYVAMAQGRIESISYTLMSLLGGSQTEDAASAAPEVQP